MSLDQQRQKIEENKNTIKQLQTLIQQSMLYQQSYSDKTIKPLADQYQSKLKQIISTNPLNLQQPMQNKQQNTQFQDQLMALLEQMKELQQQNQALHNKITGIKELTNEKIQMSQQQLELFRILKEKREQ